MSTFVDAASAASRNGPKLVWTSARPVNAAPGSAPVVVVWVPPPHAESSPPRLSNRKRLAVPSGRVNWSVSLNTMPVGSTCVATVSGALAGAGFVTYSVDVDVPLFELHNGVVGPNAMPHGLT